jgi:hypothetical protein
MNGSSTWIIPRVELNEVKKKLRRSSPAGRGINRSEAIGMTSKTTIVAAGRRDQ